MPKNYPEEVKLAALELFLDNKTGDEIAVAINQEFDLEVKAPTIYAWAKKYDWKSENASMTTKAKEIVKEKQSQRIARLQGEHLDSYEKMRKKAESELELLDFERAFEKISFTILCYVHIFKVSFSQETYIDILKDCQVF